MMIGIFPGGANLFQYAPHTAPRWAGFVANFDTAHDVIVGQLAQMYVNGMRYLRLGLEHCTDADDDGYNLSSTGSCLSGQQLANFLGLLGAIKATGFWGLEVFFGPAWWNSPLNWQNPGAWNSPDYGACVSVPSPGISRQNGWYQENWNFVVNVRTLLRQSGLYYRLDLCNEANEGVIPYAKRLWADYTYCFGKDDTVGFSLVPTHAGIAALTEIYSGNYPDVFDFHIYNSFNGDYPPVAGESQAGATLRGGLADLAKNGVPVKHFYIGECSYNDPASAADFAQYDPILLMEWPLTVAGRTAGNMLSDVVATDWTAYRQQGALS